jgi:hypothetical protein
LPLSIGELGDVLMLPQNSLRLVLIVDFLAGNLSIKTKGYGGSSAFFWFSLVVCLAAEIANIPL